MVSTFESIDSSWPGFANSSQKRHKTKGKNARLIQDSMRRNAGKEDDEKEEVILIKTKTRATGGRRRRWWPFLAKIGAGHNCVMIITEKDSSPRSVCPRTSSEVGWPSSLFNKEITFFLVNRTSFFDQSSRTRPTFRAKSSSKKTKRIVALQRLLQQAVFNQPLFRREEKNKNRALVSLLEYTLCFSGPQGRNGRQIEPVPNMQNMNFEQLARQVLAA